MFSPEVVPSQRSLRKPRKCRRKLSMEKENNHDLDKKEEANSSSNLTGDFSPDESDYVPETEEETSYESVEELPKKTAKTKTVKTIKDDCRILKEKNNNENSVCDDLVEDDIKSTFNTPTSSKLESCIGSPFFHTNQVLVDISNVQEMLKDIENIDQNSDDSYSIISDVREIKGSLAGEELNRNNNQQSNEPKDDNPNPNEDLQNLAGEEIIRNNNQQSNESNDDNPNPNEELQNLAGEEINRNDNQQSDEPNDDNPNPNEDLQNLAGEEINRNNNQQSNEPNDDNPNPNEDVQNLAGEELNRNNNQQSNEPNDDNPNPNEDLRSLADGEVNQNENNQELEGQSDKGTRRSRKRRRSEASWKDRLNKRLKNSGKSYVGVRNKKEKKEKEMGEVCNCKKECFNKITTCERSQIFERFWKLGSHDKQWEFILRHVSSQNIHKMQLERKSTRSQTIIYNLPLNVRDKLVVCKKMFLSTLGITEKWVYTAIEKEGSIIEDRRGRHLNRPHRMKETTAQSIIEHINLFPVVDSHYTRKETNRLYLDETLNLSKMYRLYKEWYGEQPGNDPTNLATKSQYERIFNTQFNYSFFKPKKDLCDTCFIYENADYERKTQLKESYDLHVKEKEEVRKLKDTEKANSSQDTMSVACFDLEKVLYIPQSEVSRFYYKRKYAVYNFTIYDVLMKKGYCYVWHQEIAKRGAIEISRCIWHYIKHEVVEKGKTEISFYSDSCAGQNRNRFVFAMFQHASRLFGVDICHRFFEKGHSQSEGDTMHACVERAKKYHTIYTPEQMYCIVSNAKVEGEKFTVKEMTQLDFYDFKELVNKPDVNWFQDDDNQKVFWSKVKEIIIKHTNPDKILYKYSLLPESETKTLTTNRVSSRRRRRGNNSNLQEVTRLNPAYTESIPVPRPLYNDLMELCSAGAIPSAYHNFYNNLNPQNSTETNQVNDASDSE